MFGKINTTQWKMDQKTTHNRSDRNVQTPTHLYTLPRRIILYIRTDQTEFSSTSYLLLNFRNEDVVVKSLNGSTKCLTRFSLVHLDVALDRQSFTLKAGWATLEKDRWVSF